MIRVSKLATRPGNCRGGRPGSRLSRVGSVVLRVCPAGLAVLLAAGCAESKAQPTSRPATLRDRQDKAIRDPFGYSPEMGTTDISGGGLSDFDRDGFGKDMKNVFDP